MGDRTWGAVSPGGLQDGFSLVEVLVAMLVLVVGIVAMASVASPIRQLQLQSEMGIEMTHIAQSKLEELRALAEGKQFGTALSTGGGVDSAHVGFSEVAEGQGVRTYSVRWLIEDGPSSTFHITARIVPLTEMRYQPPPLDFQTMVVDR